MRLLSLLGCAGIFIGACAEATPAPSNDDAARTDSGEGVSATNSADTNNGAGASNAADSSGAGAQGGTGGSRDASSDGLGGQRKTADAGENADAALSVLFRINSGGPAVALFATDQYYSGGNIFSMSNAVDTTGVTGPAPTAVYQTERFGNFTYTFPGLVMGAGYVVRLHFAEIWFTTANKRLFNVAINGAQILSAFDIYATAGANQALVEEFKVNADPAGQIAIQFSTIREDAKVSGIEVLGP